MMSDDYSTNETKERSTSFNRRSFVKALGGVGGAAITSSVFSSSAQAAAPQQLPSKSRKSIPIDELDQLARTVAEQEDVTNVMDATMRKTVQSGTAVEVSHSGPTDMVIITRDPSHIDKENGLDDRTEDDIVVSAARHTLENGNKMTALAYVTDSEAIWSRRFKEIEGGVKRKATRWKIDGETVEEARIELLQSSANGKLTKSPSDFTTTSHCSGCNGLGDGYFHTSNCTNYDLVCLSACAGCDIVSGCPACLIACVGTWCSWLLTRCCNNWNDYCQACTAGS